MFRCFVMFVMVACSGFVLAETSEVVISDDGRQIKLNADGTWQQLSRDRFTTNAAGQRIRLHPDGTWSPVTANANAPSTGTDAPVAGLQQEPVMYLSEVSILRRVIERAKSKHSETRMRFVLQVDNRTTETLPVPSDLLRRLVAKSSRGNEFPIIAATAERTAIPPGERAGVEVWVQDSPKWFGVKYLSLEVAPGTFGNGVTRILSRNMDEVDRREVDQF